MHSQPRTAFRLVVILLVALVPALALTVGVAPGGADAAPPLNAIAAGSRHSCAVLAGGTVQCWGHNNYGQLGNGTTTSSPSPVTVSGITNAISVAVGDSHSCAVLADRTVRCWGYNFYGNLGNGAATLTQSTPVVATGVTDVVALTAGQSFTCAARGDGSASCWGRNNVGQLGIDSTDTSRTTAATVATISGVESLAAGSSYACARLDDGTVWCWGQGFSGQLGNGTNDTVIAPVQTSISGVVALDASTAHACAVKGSGQVWCWGANVSGALGDGNPGVSSNTPVQVVGITTAVDVATAYNGSCATLDGATLRCWGDNGDGLLGDGTTIDRTVPVDLADPVDVALVAAGDYHMCAATTSGALSCWGSNSYGQAGSPGGVGINPTPASVATVNLSHVDSSDYGGILCGVLNATGAVQCAGANDVGQLGDGTTTPATTPVATGITGAAGVSVGQQTACAWKSNGAQCWGSDAFGALGNGAAGPSTTPVAVSGLTDVVALDSGNRHSCAVQSTGTVMCWGQGTSGEIGDGGGVARDAPATVSSITTATDVATGGSHSCAIVGTGSVSCWGAGSSGQLGNGADAGATTPVAVSGITNATAIAAGGSHTCAIVGTGSVSCWGLGSTGQLGNGSTLNSNTPVAVSGITDAVDIVAGSTHTCVRRSTGGVACWGYNFLGELGDGTTVQRSSPVDVPGIGDAVRIGGGGTICAVRSSGPPAGVWCWGHNSAGELGAFPYRTVPTGVTLAALVSLPTTTTTSTTTTSSTTTASSTTSTTNTTVAGGGGVGGGGAGGAAASAFTSLTPARFADTRPGGVTFDGLTSGGGRIGGSTVLEVPIAGRGAVPADATAVIMNLTTTAALAPGFATAYTCGTLPTASSVNFAPGSVDPNEVVAKLSATGTVCVYALADTHVIVDVVGYVARTSSYEPIEPARFADTRANGVTFDGQAARQGINTSGTTLEIPIAGRGTIPTDATAAVVNLTIAGATRAGFATAYPCGTLPTASSVNFAPGTARPNELVAKLSPTGTLCIYTLGTAHVIVDVVGHLTNA